jgi:transcriptional regulator GlxA family with amidase domain
MPLPSSGNRRIPHQVAVLVRDGVMPMELGIIHQMFGTAADRHAHRLYTVTTCTPEPGIVRTDADFGIHVEHGTNLLALTDTVLVPASHESDETPEPVDADTLGLLASLPPSTRVASICTGAFVLAAAGLLVGRRATTHWLAADRFRELHPGIELDPDVLYTTDTGVLTSAGEASGIDLCLHMIRSDYGAAAAGEVARRTIVPPHRAGGQAQYIPRGLPESGPGPTAKASAWALAHLEQPISLKDLADQEALSVRTFTRQFREHTGTSPGRWLACQRLDRARQLLEETDLSIEQVAAAAGFGTPASLRQHLHTALGVSPAAYRRTFRSPQTR